MKDILAAVNTPGAHILLAIGLGLIGVVLSVRGHEMAAGQLLQFLGIAAYAMRGGTDQPK